MRVKARPRPTFRNIYPCEVRNGNFIFQIQIS